MIVTKEDKFDFVKATRCWICEKDFEEDDKKVRDHDHLTGKYAQ